MFFRQLTQPQYDRFCLDLRKHAFSPPLSPNYIVPLIINGAEYVILLQPESHNRIAVLYAMEILREEDTVSHILNYQKCPLACVFGDSLNAGYSLLIRTPIP